MKIGKMDEKAQIARGVRAWQKQRVAKRCSIAKLAAKLHTDPANVRSILRVGPRRATRKSADKKTLLKAAKKQCRGRLCVTKIWRSKEISSFSARHGTRICKPLIQIRKKRIIKTKKMRKKEATETSQTSFVSYIHSQRYW